MIDCMLEYTEFGIPCAGCFGQFATCAGQYCFGEPHDYCYYGPDDPTWGWVCKRCLTHVSPCQDEFRPCSGFPFFLGEQQCSITFMYDHFLPTTFQTCN